MDTPRLKKFAQYARRSLLEQVGSKLNIVLAEDSPERRENQAAVAQLEKQIAATDKKQVIEKVAYLWFNRFCALRFMDVNQYNLINVLSPLEGQFQPEILAEAKAGHIDDSIVSESARKKIFGLLDGSIKSRDGQAEAFRLLIVAVCNDYSRIMPYLFERIEDYTELLMPDDLLSGNSILAYTREAMTPEACESVESIGWLYQFYISEKKDEVFDGLKKNKKIIPENIPAATQLFTPHWIVRYLVENSLGRLWMLNNPNSKVFEQMDYYIKPVEVETDFLKITSPEEIKVCDPACGSGHMLTYAYDLLYAIYLDAGYDPSGIPEKILTNNLYGIEIDERAAELAAFALTMKAVKGNPLDDSNNRRRFFRNPVEPNICQLEKVGFTDEELDSYIDFAGKDLFTQDLRATLKDFEEADNFGSLIQPTDNNVGEILQRLSDLDWSNELLQEEPHKKALRAFDQAEYLSPKYHVVVANPPYMGGGGMNPRLAAWAKDEFKHGKYDLFSMFMLRSLDLTQKKGLIAMVTMQSWMFLSRFENFRNIILGRSTIADLMQIGFNSFPELNSKVALASAFVIKNYSHDDYIGSYINLNDAPQSADKKEVFLTGEGRDDYNVSSVDLKSVPGKAIAYSASNELLSSFKKMPKLGSFVTTREGLATGCNDLFIKLWSEVSYGSIGFGEKSSDDFLSLSCKWAPYIKGGGFRKWAGNFEYVVNWSNDGEEIKGFKDEKTGRVRSHNYNGEYGFKSGFTWTGIGIEFGVRKVPNGFMFDAKGPMGFSGNIDLETIAFLNTSVSKQVIKILAPTLDFKIGHVLNMPFDETTASKLKENCKSAIEISELDWNSKELSWGFCRNPIITLCSGKGSMVDIYQRFKNTQVDRVKLLKDIEENNNKITVDGYGLSESVSSQVNDKHITLFANPAYKYGVDKSDEELSRLSLVDDITDFISYSVGCMFGRYSLDREGLILANQGDTLEEYLKQVPTQTFMPDDDNVIPLIDFDGDWFEDDITERFKQFLKVTFGEESFAENLAFIEEALGSDGKPKDIKKFFLKDFYTDHVKRYKKRPIYWMFSSSKGSFNALIYMHRYRPDTVSVVLNDYLREFRTKLAAKKSSYEQVGISASASPGEKTKAIKSVEKINAAIDEINDYEREILYPLAGQNIEIDLDNGVKHNYPLFGKALKKVPGLS
jgi:type II restriction/modification system DNA methylase subunit YeeA